MIADFEDQTAQGWLFVNDGTGEQFGTNSIVGPEQIPEGRGDSMFSAHTWGTGMTEWGAVLHFAHTPPCVDVSVVDGISFWARGNVAIWFHVTTPESVPPSGGGECLDKCYHHFGQRFALTEDWRLYAFRWEELISSSPVPIEFSHHVMGIGFGLADPGVDETSAFDYWIDDLSHFIGSPPTEVSN
jgi:hypothetical protein